MVLHDPLAANTRVNDEQKRLLRALISYAVRRVCYENQECGTYGGQRFTQVKKHRSVEYTRLVNAFCVYLEDACSRHFALKNLDLNERGVMSFEKTNHKAFYQHGAQVRLSHTKNIKGLRFASECMC